MQLYSTDEQDLADPGNKATRGRVFADEAARLLEIEKLKNDHLTKPSVSVIQGVALLWAYESNIGDADLGLLLLNEVYDLYSTFQFHSRKSRGYEIVSQSPDSRRAKATANLAWGFYSVAASVLMYLNA